MEAVIKAGLPFRQPLISGIPEPAAAGANCVTIYTEENTRHKLIEAYTTKPARQDVCTIANVAENFHPAKFSTARLMKTAANAVPGRHEKK